MGVSDRLISADATINQKKQQSIREEVDFWKPEAVSGDLNGKTQIPESVNIEDATSKSSKPDPHDPEEDPRVTFREKKRTQQCQKSRQLINR